MALTCQTICFLLGVLIAIPAVCSFRVYDKPIPDRKSVVLQVQDGASEEDVARLGRSVLADTNALAFWWRKNTGFRPWWRQRPGRIFHRPMLLSRLRRLPRLHRVIPSLSQVRTKPRRIRRINKHRKFWKPRRKKISTGKRTRMSRHTKTTRKLRKPKREKISTAKRTRMSRRKAARKLRKPKRTNASHAKLPPIRNNATYTMYHGTSCNIARPVARYIELLKPTSGVLGRCVYLSRDKNKTYALAHSKGREDGSGPCILRVEVNVGRVKTITHLADRLRKTWMKKPSPGYDSAWIPPESFDLASNDEEKYCVAKPNRIRQRTIIVLSG